MDFDVIDKYSPTPDFTSTPGTREYFPEKIGFYTVANTNPKENQYRPKVMALPPTNLTYSFTYKDMTFTNVAGWLGYIYAKPFIVPFATIPTNATYVGTDDRLFAPVESSKITAKTVPIFPRTGVEIPEFFDVKTKDEDILKKFSRGGKVSEPDDNGTLLLTGKPQISYRVYTPVLTFVVKEDEDEEGKVLKTIEPVLTFFEDRVGSKKAEKLVNLGVLTNKYDTKAYINYLVGDVADKVGSPIFAFDNPHIEDPTFVTLSEDFKLPKWAAPFKTLKAKTEVDRDTLERLLALEVIKLISRKEDKTSLDAKIKSFYYTEISNSRQTNNNETK